AALSTMALGVAWYAGADALGLLREGGVALPPLVVVFAALAFRTGRLGSNGPLFAAPAEPLIHVSAVVAVLVTYGGGRGGPLGFADWRSVATRAGPAPAHPRHWTAA